MATSSTIDQALNDLQLNDSSDKTAAAAAFLVDHSRASANVRSRLSNRRILAALVEVVDREVLRENFGQAPSALRCIGNACNDDGGGDEARTALSELGFAWAKKCLSRGDPELTTVTVMVISNACSQHEAAQRECYKEFIHYDLAKFLSEDSVEKQPPNWEAARNLAVDLLLDICGHKTALAPESSLGSDFLHALLDLPTRPWVQIDDGSNMDTLLETALGFLRDVVVQVQVIEAQLVDQVWKLLGLTNGRLTTCRSATSDPSDEDVKTEINILEALTASFTWVLSDIAANSVFATRYGINDAFVEMLIRTVTDEYCLRRWPQTEQTDWSHATDREINAAFQMIGNLLWTLPPDSYTSLVKPESKPAFRERYARSGIPEIPALHDVAFEFMIDCTNDELLHSAAGLLMQLARPSIACRTLIGASDRAAPALQVLCHHERQELRQDAVKLLKALGRDCRVNQERFTDMARDVMASLAAEAQQSTGNAVGNPSQGSLTTGAIIEEDQE